MDRISKGDIPPKITEVYTGDFNAVKNNLNVCIDAISQLVNDGVTLTKAMLDGKPVSYTHLDVYKRQISRRRLPTITTAISTRSRTT